MNDSRHTGSDGAGGPEGDPGNAPGFTFDPGAPPRMIYEVDSSGDGTITIGGSRSPLEFRVAAPALEDLKAQLAELDFDSLDDLPASGKTTTLRYDGQTAVFLDVAQRPGDASSEQRFWNGLDRRTSHVASAARRFVRSTFANQAMAASIRREEAAVTAIVIGLTPRIDAQRMGEARFGREAGLRFAWEAVPTV